MIKEMADKIDKQTVRLKTEHGELVIRPVFECKEQPAYVMFVYINGDIKMRRVGRIKDGFTLTGAKGISIEMDEDVLDKTEVNSVVTYTSSGADK